MIRLPVLSVLLLLAGLVPLGAGCVEAEGQAPPAAERIQSVTLDARRVPPPGTLETLRTLGVTHVTLISFGFQPGYTVPEIRMHTDASWYSESDSGILTLAAEAKALGMHIIVKPHIWVGEYSTDGQSRHTIGFETEEAWQQWEAQYRRLLMHYAHLAEAIDAPILVVGTELAHVAKTREAFWRGLIEEIRAVYGGALTYAANWYDEYEHVPFWDALDYIGIQAYFELSPDEAPELYALQEGWGPYKETMAALAARVGKPVFFTEIGYRSVGYAARQPWRWPARDETAPPDDALQARLYEAFFESLWHEPWFAGAILWKWYPEPAQRRQRHLLDFTPQNKPAEAVIARWFGGTVPGLSETPASKLE